MALDYRLHTEAAQQQKFGKIICREQPHQFRLIHHERSTAGLRHKRQHGGEIHRRIER